MITNHESKSLESYFGSFNPNISEDLHQGVIHKNSLWLIGYGTGKLHRIDLKTKDTSVFEFPPVYYEAITFSENDTGWLTGAWGLTYKTTDGGKSWDEYQLNIANKIPYQEGMEMSSVTDEGWMLLPYSCIMFDNDRGLISGAKVSYVNRQMEPLYLMCQNGKTWTEVTEDENAEPMDFLKIKYSEFDDTTAYAISRKKIYRSNDRGRIWSLVYEETNAEVKEQFRGLHIEGDTVWICGFSGRVLSSSDTGQNWNIGQVSENRLRAIAFTDSLNGFAAGDLHDQGNLFVTHDGGKTWQSLDGVTNDIHDIILDRSQQDVYLIGKGGLLLTSNTDL